MHYKINGLNISLDGARFRLSGEGEDLYANISLTKATFELLKHYKLIAPFQTWLTVQLVTDGMSTQEYFCEWSVQR